MELRETKISGCYELIPKVFSDVRGTFVKIFHENIFQDYGLDTNFTEGYYSTSHKNVLRGLHFQTPPRDHTKVVYCVLGEVMDVVVDLRVGSPTYGKFETFNLSAEKPNLVYVPRGLAHGFYVTSDLAIMTNKVSTVYSPENDAGLLWDSVGIPWMSDNPIMSKRDRELIKFADFDSPFVYGENP
jgi:dTDP-4-dehydrorhamnose 3,5-epimerase